MIRFVRSLTSLFDSLSLLTSFGHKSLFLPEQFKKKYFFTDSLFFIGFHPHKPSHETAQYLSRKVFFKKKGRIKLFTFDYFFL